MKRKLISVFAVITALISVCALPCSAAYVQDNSGNYYLLGDVNSDGTVDIRDLVRLKKYSADKTVEVATVISDDDVNALDLSFLRKLILNGDDSFLDTDGNWSKEFEE